MVIAVGVEMERELCPFWDYSAPVCCSWAGGAWQGRSRLEMEPGVQPHVCALARWSPGSGAPSRERALGLVPRCQGRHEGLWRGLAGLPVGTPEAKSWPPCVGRAGSPREGEQVREA